MFYKGRPKDESAENVTRNKEASSTTTTGSIEKFQLDFYRVDVHFLFSDEEKKAIYERFNTAKQFLINFLTADSRCTQVWANIIDGAYGKMTERSPKSQIYQLLFTSSTTTRSMLQKLIAEKIITAIVHPNAAASPSVLDPNRTKEYVTTTRFQDKALIAINPMVFNNETTIHGSRISGESCTLFLAMLLAHEITHAVKYIGQSRDTIPELPFFRTYSDPDKYDELFIIGSNGQHIQLSPSDINCCLTNNTIQSLSSLVERSRRKPYYENDENNEKYVPLLRYHTRKSVVEETDNVYSDERYEALLKYHCEKDTSQGQSPDDALL